MKYSIGIFSLLVLLWMISVLIAIVSPTTVVGLLSISVALIGGIIILAINLAVV